MANKRSIKSAKVAAPGEFADSRAASKIRFSATLLAEGDCESRLVDLSDPAKGSQCEAPLAEHDVGGRHVQWLGLSSHAPA
jgi:hypothetical protein